MPHAFVTVLPLPPCAPGADPDRPFCQVYTFQLGDTLKSVAEKFDTTEAELIKLNSGGSRDRKHSPGAVVSWTPEMFACWLGLCTKGAACLQLQGFRHSPLFVTSEVPCCHCSATTCRLPGGRGPAAQGRPVHPPARLVSSSALGNCLVQGNR